MQHFIKSHEFLGKIFPNGMEKEKVAVGDVKLRNSGSALFSIHICSKPEIDIKKWGVWGEDYNVVVVDLVLSDIISLDVKNWGGVIWSDIEESSFQVNKKYTCFEKKNFSLKVYYEHIIFQSCRVYKNNS